MKSCAVGELRRGFRSLRLRGLLSRSAHRSTFNEMRAAVNALAIARWYHVATGLNILFTVKYVEFYSEMYGPKTRR